MGIAARHSDGGGNGGSSVTDGEKVVIGFQRAGKTANVTFLTQFFEIRRPTGQHLVRIALMPHIPKQPIRPGWISTEVIYVVQGEGQLNHAEIRRQMPAVFADGGENSLADFLGKSG